MERQEDIDRALEKHKETMGRRYVEVFESRQSVMDKIKKTTDRDRSPGAGRRGPRSGGSSQFCVKLRGLPWSATKVPLYHCNISLYHVFRTTSRTF